VVNRFALTTPSCIAQQISFSRQICGIEKLHAITNRNFGNKKKDDKLKVNDTVIESKTPKLNTLYVATIRQSKKDLLKSLIDLGSKYFV
jgi:hypothetical protein